MKEKERKVLEVFERVSPSFTEADTDAQFNSLVKRRTNLLLNLKINPASLSGKKLIDMGCGTGENSSVYAYYGASVSGIEFNQSSIDRMVSLFKSRGLVDYLKVIYSDPISAWIPPESEFDFGMSLGVIHHLSNPRDGVAKLSRAIKPGGVMVISTGGAPGDEQRQLMRKIVSELTSDLSDAVGLSKRLFPEYIYRATTLGFRTAEQVVNDNFLVPQNISINLTELLEWFYDEGFMYYRVAPNIEPKITDSLTNSFIDWFLPEYRSNLIDSARIWSLCRDGGAHDARLSIKEEYEKGLKELLRVRELADRKDLIGLEDYLPTCRYFGRGLCGVGDYYVVGIKKW